MSVMEPKSEKEIDEAIEGLRVHTAQASWSRWIYLIVAAGIGGYVIDLIVEHQIKGWGDIITSVMLAAVSAGIGRATYFLFVGFNQQRAELSRLEKLRASEGTQRHKDT